MNLAKKGTVLLAALSVFAMTSCGPKYISYENSVKWIKDHYDEKETTRNHTANKHEWDFTKTTDKASQEFALNILSEVVEEKVTELKGSADQKLVKPEEETAMTPEQFEEEIGPMKDQCKFSSSNNDLTVTSEQDFPVYGDIIAKVTLVAKFDNKCFGYYQEFQFNNSTAKVGDKTYTVTGYLKTTFVFHSK